MTLVNTAPLSQVDCLLTELDKLPEQFYLTGSRRFGNVKPESDYDFFTQYDFGLINSLLALGFHDVGKENAYRDMDCRTVMHHDCGIDIQLRTDVDTYERVCRFVECNWQARLTLNNMDKLQRHVMWDIMLHLRKF